MHRKIKDFTKFYRRKNSTAAAFNRYAFIFVWLMSVGELWGQHLPYPIEVRVPWHPQITIIKGQPVVYYEIHLSNRGSHPYELTKLEIIQSADSTLLKSYNLDELKKTWSSPRKDAPLELQPGTFATLYLEVVLPQQSKGWTLIHKLYFSSEEEPVENDFYIQGCETKIINKMPVILGAPLKGGPWVAIYEPSWPRGHRRVIYTVDGTPRIPGRFAIDFMRVDEKGRYATGNTDSIKNWLGYENDVIAVADGKVLSVRNDFTESATLSAHPDYQPEKGSGNYISIDIGNGYVIFYEHLKPGSIRVKPGEKVRKGEVLASLGFTGQTTGPHLHFHVANVNSPLGGEGVPFSFDSFSLLGAYDNLDKFGEALWRPVNEMGPRLIQKERPKANAVIVFPSK
jgi:hypothetical protein